MDVAEGQSLDLRYKAVLRVRAIIAGLVLIALATAAEFVLASAIGWEPGPAIIAAVCVSILAAALFPGRRYRRWRFAERDEALEIAHGLLVRVETAVPFGRVQHIDITRGPIERSFGVATLALHTAGSHNSLVTLPGLLIEQAEAMRGRIREHIRLEIV